MLRRHCAAVHVFRAGGQHPCQVARHASIEATAHVAAIAERGIDVIHVEGFYLMQHVPEAIDVPVVLVEQNVEYQLWRQRVETASDEETRRAHFLMYRQTRE